MCGIRKGEKRHDDCYRAGAWTGAACDLRDDNRERFARNLGNGCPFVLQRRYGLGHPLDALLRRDDAELPSCAAGPAIWAPDATPARPAAPRSLSLIAAA
jgi:hypothetical protein